MGHLNPKMESNLVIIVIKQNVLAHLLGVKSQRGFPPAHCVVSYVQNCSWTPKENNPLPYWTNQYTRSAQVQQSRGTIAHSI